MTLSLIKNSSRNAHMQLLGTLYLLLRNIRSKGLMSIENDVETPQESALFAAIAPFDTANETVYTFLCDVMRLMVGGNLNAEEMSAYMAAYRKTTDVESFQDSMLEVVRLTLTAAIQGYAPQVAVEFGRQGFPAAIKPSFGELEEYLRELQRSPEPNAENVDAQLDAFFDSIGSA